MKQKTLIFYFVILLFSITLSQNFSTSTMDEILYGVSYYYEYMPYERLEKDAEMMKECGINVVRICESTWAYMEPQDGKFNLDYVGCVLDVMHENGIKVIVGTPTYAVPTWLAKKYPEILKVTKDGKSKYGSRQNMDIAHPKYRFYAERIIRKLIDYVHDHPAVIGYQVDNETKHYDNANENVQLLFVEHLKKKFTSPQEMTKAYGLNYWSNSISNWEDMTSTLGAINGSLLNEFEKFQRKLVTEFLAWQTQIVNEYKKPEQFITQNFDLSWRSGSYGIQPRVDHFEASKPLDVAGIDVYHKTQDELDGVTIALAGDIARSMKQNNYFVIETSAQSILGPAEQDLHYPGQLRMQAYSHLASGANMIMYWPWHSIHNSLESFWKGLLSHDLEPNPTYYEAKKNAKEFKNIGQQIISLKKQNNVAIYFSNESFTALKLFPFSYKINYNDVLRQMYEILYKSNIECDFIDHTVEDFSQYDLILVPPLYTASDDELEKLNKFAKKGGHIIYAFKSGFTNENVKVRAERMPAVLREACGFSYQQFTSIDTLYLKDNPFKVNASENFVTTWAELLTPETAEVLAWYSHPHWGKYAAITSNKYGKGTVTYFGTLPSKEILKKIILNVCNKANVRTVAPAIEFPIIVKKGKNKFGNDIYYFFNYSSINHEVKYPFANGLNILDKQKILSSEKISIDPWELKIIEVKKYN